MVLAMAAKILPDALLHNLTTIFTFMGEGLLLRDDEFSSQVIESSIKTLVPILVEGNRNNAAVVAIIQVFVDNFPDIPQHRRLNVFKLLTSALHPEHHLWLVNLLITKSYVTRDRPLKSHVDEVPGVRIENLTGEKRRSREMPIEVSFALQLTAEFSVQEQISAARSILALITDVPTNIGSGYESNWCGINNHTTVLGLPLLSGKHLRHFLYVNLGFLFHLFSSESFIAAVVPVSESVSEMDTLLEAYQDLLTTTSAYLTTVTQLEATTRGQDAIANKFWNSLQCKVIELLDSICSLLPPRLLIRVTSQLMGSPLPSVRSKTLELFRTRLLPSAAFFTAADSDLLLPLLPHLQLLASSKKETDACRQVALGSLQLLLRFLAPQLLPEHVSPALDCAVSLITEKSQLLAMQSLLVVAECVGILGTESISVLPRLLPSLLAFLIPSTNDTTAEHFLLSTISALYKVVECVPQFLSPWVEELLVRLCHVASQLTPGKESSFTNKMNSLATLIHERIKPRVLLPAILRAYNKLCASYSLSSVRGLLEMIVQVIAHLDRKTLIKEHHHLLAMLKQALAARHSYSDTVSVSEIESVECTAVAAVMKLVMRQDEATNISTITDLQQWADGLASAFSRASLYRVLEQMVKTLKVVFIKARLADHIFNHAVATLTNSNNSCKGTLKNKASAGDACLELERVLNFLSLIFEHDSVGFTTAPRFEQCMEPLIQQIRNTTGGMRAYTKRINEQLRPCMINFCSASRNDALWADLNRKMLMLLRQDLPTEVHVSVLLLNLSLVEKFGEDWLQPLLTDSLQYVTEALESSQPQVEEQARQLLAVMEEKMGDAVREQLEV